MTYSLKPIMTGSAYIRTSVKLHHCSGGHDGTQRTKCDAPITKGEKYVEYLGDSPAYQSGKRYHMRCAEQHGIVEQIA